MKAFKLILSVVFLSLCFVVLNGCESVEGGDDDYDQKPWTEREDWENAMPGIPF